MKFYDVALILVRIHLSIHLSDRIPDKGNLGGHRVYSTTQFEGTVCEGREGIARGVARGTAEGVRAGM